MPRLVPIQRLAPLLLATVLLACSGAAPSSSPSATAPPSGSTPSASSPPASSPGTGSTATSAVPTLGSLPPRPTAPPGSTGWQRVLAGIGSDGTVPLDVALQAFALAIGPLPGVEVPPGERGAIHSGSGAIRWVLAHWNELTAEQRAAVETYLRPSTQSVRTAALGMELPRAAAATNDWVAWLDAAAEKLAGKLGRVMTGDFIVQISSQPHPDGVAAASALALNAEGGYLDGEMTSCVVTVYPLADQFSDLEQEAFALHEAFHCFEGDLTTIEAGIKRPPWIAEGMAEWAMASLIPAPDIVAGWWREWLSRPHIGLFGRTYDALGFYAMLEANGRDPWTVLDQLILAFDAGSSINAYIEAGNVTGEDLVLTWGPRYARTPAIGPRWEMTGPLITADRPPAVLRTIDAGATATVDAPPYAGDSVILDLKADVVVLRGDAQGLVAFADLRQERLADLDGKPLCTRGQPCVCGPDSPMAGVAFEQVLPGVTLVGVTGHHQGDAVAAQGFSLDEFCDQEPEVEVDPCLVGRWIGDPLAFPHHVTKGGDGIVLTIAADGATRLDYDAMNALVSSPEGSTTEIRLLFLGSATGRIRTEAGIMHGIGQGDLSQAVVVYRVFQDGRLVGQDAQNLGELTADLGAIPVYAFGSVGDGTTYTCTPTQLTLFPPVEGLVVTYQRSGT